MAASRDRRASIIDDEAEDVDEVTLDASHETGLRKVQVSTWLLFEDSTSSLGAKVVQGVLLMLILISTSWSKEGRLWCMGVMILVMIRLGV